MKTRNLLMIALGLALSASVCAQDGLVKDKVAKEVKTPEEKAIKQTEGMKKNLQLTDEQATKVKEINMKYAKDGAAKNESMKAERKAQKEAKDADLKKVLSPEQFSKFEERRAARKAAKEAKMEQRHEKMKQ